MVQKWVSIALVFPFEFRVVFAFIILEILTGHKKKKQYVNFLHVHRKNTVKEKKKSSCRSGFPLLFLCILLKCSFLLLSRARNGHGRAHWLDGIGDFGETIPNFLTYVYWKVKLASLFLLSSVAHSHILLFFRKIKYVRLDHLLPVNLQTQHQFCRGEFNPCSQKLNRTSRISFTSLINAFNAYCTFLNQGNI